MSKSLGNSPDPLDVIAKYGADALRFTIVSLAPPGEDVRYAVEKTDLGRHFANKIWNATRFVLMNLDAQPPDLATLDATALGLPERWILSRLQAVIDEVRARIHQLPLQRRRARALSVHLARVLRLVRGAEQGGAVRRRRRAASDRSRRC